MQFDNTYYLLFLWLVPFLFLFYIYSLRKKAKLLNKFANKKTLEKILNVSSKKIHYIKAVMMLLICTSGVIALAEPKFGYTWEEIKRKGVDIVVAVDVSKSMLAEDIKPSRLQRAKMKLHDLLGILQGDRVALVAFAGTSFLECPLTLDYEAFQIFLDYLDPSLIPVPGTSFSNALETASKAFSADSGRGKSIIMITDGEDQDEGLKSVLPTLKEKGIRVFTIGIGKEEGIPIPDEKGGLKKDENGNVILTKLNVKTLEEIAVSTGGQFVRSSSGDIDLQKIYTDGIKANTKDNDFKSSKKQVWQQRFQIFVGIGLILLILEMLLSEQIKIKKIKV